MAKCDKCGADIHWAVTETGARVPLDVLSKVFAYDKGGEGMGKARPAQANTFVSHYAVCTKGAAKRPPETGGDRRGSFEENPDATEFIKRLDAAGIELNDFETQFVEGFVEKAKRYGVCKFSENQLGVVEKLRGKYESMLPHEHDSRPAQPPRQAPPREDEEPPTSNDDSIPF